MTPRSRDELLEALRARDPHHDAFLSRVERALTLLWPFLEANPGYREERLLERLCEPDRVIQFRVVWQDDGGRAQVNRGWRVQFSSALGPYKGGLRFRPGLTLDVLKFLAFEQTFKNSLTDLPMGAGKGGADFDPRGRSRGEVMRFCQAFMTALHGVIGGDVDVPAGDMGVGAREVGLLFGQYRRLSRSYGPSLTGKPLALGGSPLRTEATGYGCVYFAQALLEHQGRALEGARCVVSGAGNVALHAAEKLAALGAKVLTLSDSDGFVHDPRGIDGERLAFAKTLKLEQRGRIREYAEHFGCDYHEGAAPWGAVECDLAFPCATQDEIDAEAAGQLAGAGCLAVIEGANGPTTSDARVCLSQRGVLLAPDIAANAGGVAVSGLEMTQNLTRRTWSRERVDDELRGIMSDIHRRCLDCAGEDGGDGPVDYERGALVAGFQRVAAALRAGGLT